jgi:exodeoxyribonuclease VII small subunit
MSGSEKKEINQLTYEKAFQELEEIVAALESNQAPLDETMELFERGQKLLQRCADLLEKAELRLKTLDELEANDDESVGEPDL